MSEQQFSCYYYQREAKTGKSRSGTSERTIVRHKHDLGYIILSSLVKEISINAKRYINT